MARYLIETRGDVSCCFDCPLFSYGYECELEHRDNLDNADEKPEWCPLNPIDGDTRYSVTYEGNRTDMYYECGACFETLEDAKRWISEFRSEEQWHDFEIVEHVDFSNLVYKEK